MKAAVDEGGGMAGDDFLEPDVPEYDESESPHARDVDAERPDRDPEGEAEGAIAPEERIGHTPPD
jgi:hypothetical protein